MYKLAYNIIIDAFQTLIIHIITILAHKSYSLIFETRIAVRMSKTDENLTSLKKDGIMYLLLLKEGTKIL